MERGDLCGMRCWKFWSIPGYPYSVQNTAPWLTTVGARSIDRAFRVDILLGDGESYMGSSLYSSNGINTEVSPLMYAGLYDSMKIPPFDFVWKIAVCTATRTIN